MPNTDETASGPYWEVSRTRVESGSWTSMKYGSSATSNEVGRSRVRRSGASPTSTWNRRIGGAPAQITYAGVAPGLIAGVLQINAIVPLGIAPDKAAAIDVTIGGATSPAGVTVAVQ